MAPQKRPPNLVRLVISSASAGSAPGSMGNGIDAYAELRPIGSARASPVCLGRGGALSTVKASCYIASPAAPHQVLDAAVAGDACSP